MNLPIFWGWLGFMAVDMLALSIPIVFAAVAPGNVLKLLQFVISSQCTWRSHRTFAIISCGKKRPQGRILLKHGACFIARMLNIARWPHSYIQEARTEEDFKQMIQAL